MLVNKSYFTKICSIIYQYIRQYFHTRSTISMNNALRILCCASFKDRYEAARAKVYAKINSFCTPINNYHNLLKDFQNSSHFVQEIKEQFMKPFWFGIYDRQVEKYLTKLMLHIYHLINVYSVTKCIMSIDICHLITFFLTILIFHP